MHVCIIRLIHEPYTAILIQIAFTHVNAKLRHSTHLGGDVSEFLPLRQQRTCSQAAKYAGYRLFFFQQQDVLGVLLACQVRDCFVHRDQDESFAQSQPQQVGVRHLLGAIQPGKERAA